MKESGRAALSYAKAQYEHLGIPEEALEDREVHIHVPAGAIPKDGPSAGITMATALVSALSGRKVRRDVAMTGELTLTGRVLPIGGLKEKILGGVRAGINEFILPRENEADLEDIPEEVAENLTFHAVEDLDQVIAVALMSEPPTSSGKGRVGRGGKKTGGKTSKGAGSPGREPAGEIVEA
jgi:ATP-dependent Lon protease